MSTEKTRTISGAILAAMRAAGWLRTDGYRLKDGFNGDITIDDVKATKTQGADSDNNFRIVAKNDKGTFSIPGAVIANARWLPEEDATKVKAVEGTAKGKSAIWMREEIEDHLQASQVFNEAKGMDDDDFEFPEKLHIVGALVDEDPDVEGYPRFPLRAFKYYNQVLRHHRKVTGEKNVFMTRDEFKAYIEAEADRPKGVPENYKELALLDSIDKDEAKNWQFTLLVKDVAE